MTEWEGVTQKGRQKDRREGVYNLGERARQGHVNPNQFPVPWWPHLLFPWLLSVAITFSSAEIDRCLEAGWS